MRRPITVFLLASALLQLTLSSTAVAQEVETSRAALADSLVEEVMQCPVGMRLGFWVQQGRMLGDQVAAAVARKLRLSDLLDSDKANRVLELLQFAFEDASYIAVEEDKKPGVTLLLLDHLADYSPDSAVREQSKKLIGKLTGLRAGRTESGWRSRLLHQGGRLLAN